ncbi:MAG: hypothetical protein ACTHN0_14645, partial [Aquihabitans sp.]
ADKLGAAKELVDLMNRRLQAISTGHGIGIGLRWRRRDDLDEALATMPEGLAVYDKISSYGQWFQIRTKITCLANQKTCVDEAMSSSALDDGLTLASAQSVVDFALQGAKL